jgi:hypothetical protein
VCNAAYATFTRGDTCDLDGGVIHPDSGADASIDAGDASTDASDASIDATAE